MNIGLIAHDSKKKLMQNFCIAYRGILCKNDPLTPKSHEPDVNNVVKICDTHNIPLATNLATAELLIKSLDRGDLEWREMYK